VNASASGWSAAATGFALGLGLIVAIGAQNAFVLSQGLRRERVGAIVAFCALSDALLMLAGVAGVGQLLGQRPLWVQALTAAGALFLAVYGARALLRARSASSLGAAAPVPALSLGAALAQAAAFTYLNPHVYLDTVLLVGTVGTRYSNGVQWWFAAGAATSSLLWFAALGFGARLLAPVFAKPSAWRCLDLVVGLTLLALATGLGLSLVRQMGAA
jgi:L-lysine exporter family protein LysE/ArgO